MAHCALSLTIKLDSTASAMIEWQVGITLLLEASVRFLIEFRTLSHLQPRQRKANHHMTDASPTTVNRTLPTRLPHSAYRVREYLTEKEVDRLIEAARKRGRNGARDAAAILYRVPEIVTRGRFPDGGESDSTWRTQEARHVGSDTIAPGF